MDAGIIRKAICRNRGGLENATDEQIMSLWNSLDPQTQEFYLQSLDTFTKGKDVINAARNESKSTI
jgi:hypothetical protein